MENKKLISVIIPIYNCEKTITATLQSIIGQSYESLEIILVDDGSIDNSYKICNNYAKKDSRIKLIKQINSGVGAARNKGLDNCNGDYISFIDADDTVNENFYEELIGAAVMTDADIVGCNVCVNIDDNCLYPYGNNNQKLIYIDNQIIEKYLNFEISTAVWGKLYSKGIIGNLKFEKLSINEDFIFSWELIKKSKIFFQNNNTNYNYYANTPNSLTKEKFNCNNMSLVTHADNVMKDITCISEKLLEAGENYYYACVLHNFILYYNYLRDNKDGELYINEKNIMINILRGCKKIKKGLLIQETDVNIDELINQVNCIAYSDNTLLHESEIKKCL